MKKIWSKDNSQAMNIIADEYNRSIKIDSRMFIQDITASISHTKMLVKQKIIDESSGNRIVDELNRLLSGLISGEIEIDYQAEDIHSFVEDYLIKTIGDAGKKLHTARSRNDQVATDLRLYLRKENEFITELLIKLIRTLKEKALEYKDYLMPGYTHLQRAQPITFGHHLLAYAMMFDRDADRLKDAYKRINISPLGAGALAGTTYPIDREFVKEDLGFEQLLLNSLDAVSERDFCIELNSAIAIIMMHLSRFCEELILWASHEFGFIKISDAFSTGSSIMPQKKNPDIAELIRGKTGRVYGNLIGILTVMKSLPLAYNKDLQEDKEAVFDSVDTVKNSLTVFQAMMEEVKPKRENMRKAASFGYINSTDLADYLVKKGISFRDSYVLTGRIIEFCDKNNKELEKMSLEEYKSFSDLFEEDLYRFISMEECVQKRACPGGPSEEALQLQISYLEQKYSG